MIANERNKLFFTNRKETRYYRATPRNEYSIFAETNSFALVWSGTSLMDRSMTTVGCCAYRSTGSFNERGSPQLQVERETRASSSAAARLIDLNWQSSRLRLERPSDRSSHSNIGHKPRTSLEWVIPLSPHTHNSCYLRNEVHFVTKHKLLHYVVPPTRWLAISNWPRYSLVFRCNRHFILITYI